MKSSQDLQLWVEQANVTWPSLSLGQRLQNVVDQFPTGAKFSSSLGLEDQVLLHEIAAFGDAIRCFVIDTGRHFEETWDVFESSRRRYKVDLEVFGSEPSELAALVRRQGMLGFYESVENRKDCCHVRKVLPLRRALQGAQAWIVGLRRGQNALRNEVPFVQWDQENGLLKIAPLADWDWDRCVQFTQENNVPISRLHAKGFPSIGCAPCTRAVKPGEDQRAGRWWWESGNSECGLHVAH